MSLEIIASLEAEVERLRAELERLRTRSALTLFGGATVAVPGGRTTVLGLDEMVITVGADDTVGYVNTAMMRLLGIEERQAALGAPLARWDEGVLGSRALAALVQVARGSQETQVLEREFEQIPAERLPEAEVPGGGANRTLRFVVSSKDGRVQIVAQDVTRTRWLERTFSRYVSPKVIEQLQGIPTSDLLAMERRELTILFCDLRGFTRLCQSSPPLQVQETVNSFLSNMCGCVERMDGTVIGFAGDEVMAVFGAPVPQDDHALRGLICAVEMQRVHAAWTAEREARGEPVPGMGAGLATGSVVVGNIGTERRMGYTAQGHPVNLAARLCGAAGAGEVLTVPETHRAAMDGIKGYQGEVQLPRVGFESRGKMPFKNVAEPVEVLAVKTKG